MPWLRMRYCGVSRYLSNSTAQSPALSGGTTPVTGRHSVIESPEPVSRVAPPTATIATTSTASR